MHLSGCADVAENFAKRAPHVFPGNDEIHKSVVLHELRSLESWWQIGVGGLLHHSGSGKTDHALGLGNDDVAQRREAGGNSAGGWMGEDRNIRAPGLRVSGQRSAGLGHLHETENALMHAGTA